MGNGLFELGQSAVAGFPTAMTTGDGVPVQPVDVRSPELIESAQRHISMNGGFVMGTPAPAAPAAVPEPTTKFDNGEDWGVFTHDEGALGVFVTTSAHPRDIFADLIAKKVINHGTTMDVRMDDKTRAVSLQEAAIVLNDRTDVEVIARLSPGVFVAWDGTNEGGLGHLAVCADPDADVFQTRRAASTIIANATPLVVADHMGIFDAVKSSYPAAQVSADSVSR